LIFIKSIGEASSDVFTEADIAI